MLKTLLLAGTIAIAAPAFAQTTPSADRTVPATPQSTATAPTTAPAEAAAPTQAETPTTPAPADGAATAAAATPSQSQVAQVVDQQFGTYDKDANGSLSKAEFATWMTALKTEAKAATGAPAQETAWNDAAFKQADGDKSTSVTKTELTGFLVKGASGRS